MTSQNRMVQQIASDLVARTSFENSLTLQFGECSLHIEANQEEIVARLRHYYRLFIVDQASNAITIRFIEGDPPVIPGEFAIKQPDPGKQKIKEEYLNAPDGRIVHKRLTGMMFLFGDNFHLGIGPCRANMNQVVNFINNRYIQWLLERDCLLGHAAGVADQGRGLSLAGFSGMGKSTLALHLVTAGASFVSNDRVLIREEHKGITMYGIPKQPRINPGTIMNNPSLRDMLSPEETEHLSSMSHLELWQLEQKYDVIIEEAFGDDRYQLEAPLDILVILNWHHDGTPTVVQEVNISERRDLLRAFMKETGLFFLPVPGTTKLEFPPDDYIRLLSRCAVYEISGGVDLAKATAACRELLQGKQTHSGISSD